MRVQDKEIKPLVAGDSFEQIGATLKHARRLQGLKIGDLSQQLRISVDYLSKLESGAFDENDRATWGNPGRNEACPCGSGKKFKHCHGRL